MALKTTPLIGRINEILASDDKSPLHALIADGYQNETLYSSLEWMALGRAAAMHQRECSHAHSLMQVRIGKPSQEVQLRRDAYFTGFRAAQIEQEGVLFPLASDPEQRGRQDERAGFYLTQSFGIAAHHPDADVKGIAQFVVKHSQCWLAEDYQQVRGLAL